MTKPCPRQIDEMMAPVPSEWREDGTCSYCGSMSPDQFFAAIEAGYELGPTDKNYKIYVHRPNPHLGQPRVLMMSNRECKGDGWLQITVENLDTLPLSDWQRANCVGEYAKVGPDATPHTHEKFYFQHLSEDEMSRFIDLHNQKAIKYSHPGYLYRLPFFCTREGAS